jgi:hypothetical protein
MIAESEKVLNDYTRESFLKAHNQVRKDNNLIPLNWDPKLALFAKSWLSHLSKKCQLFSSNSEYTGYTENIDQKWGSRVYTPFQIVRKWTLYKGLKYKNMIWPKTTKLGCAYALCKDPGSAATSTLYACYYSPSSH